MQKFLIALSLIVASQVGLASYFTPALGGVVWDAAETGYVRIKAPASAPAEWSPAIDPPLIWQDFSDTSSLTLDYSAGQTTIAVARNKGNGAGAPAGASTFDFWSPTKSLQPLFVPNAVNGLSVAEFTGDQAFSASGSDGSGPRYMNYAFGNPDTATIYDDWVYVIYLKSSGYLPNAVIMQEYNWTAYLQFDLTSPDSKIQFNRAVLTDSSLDCTALAAHPNELIYVLVSMSRTGPTSGTASLYINGVLQETKTTTSRALHSLDYIMFFQDQNGNSRIKAKVAEHFLYPNRTAAQMLGKAGGYGQTKWNWGAP